MQKSKTTKLPKLKANKKRGKPSSMMEQLYGAEHAKELFDRLNHFDTELCDVTQDVAYDVFWARPGLPTRDKSLITVAALITMGLERQTKVHMQGFLNSGGTVDELRGAILHLAVYCGFPRAIRGFAALREVRDALPSARRNRRPARARVRGMKTTKA